MSAAVSEHPTTGELGRIDSGEKGDGPVKILSGIIASILLSLAATSAGAVIMLSPTPSGTGNNVLFNLQPPNQTGTTIFGNINDVTNTLVDFTSTQLLTTPSSGQARIESVPDNVLNNLQTTIRDFSFLKPSSISMPRPTVLQASVLSTSLAPYSASYFL